MPKRPGTWSAWNYVGEFSGVAARLCVTYWMNRLQGLPSATPLFVTLNPYRDPNPLLVIQTEVFEHPLFDAAAMRAQSRLWSLQGDGNTWWCGSYFAPDFMRTAFRRVSPWLKRSAE